MPVARMMPDRLVIVAAVVLSACLFLPAAADPVNTVKLLVAAWAALGALGLAGVRAARTRVLRVPRGPLALAVLAMLAGLVVATATAPVTTTAVVGAYGRNSGLVAYASALVLALTVLTVFTAKTLPLLCVALMVSGGFTASYGLLQRLGVDAITWSNPFNPIIAALGNPDFVSGYLGICVPAAAWGVLRAGSPGTLRLSCAALTALMGVVALLSGSIQGPMAAAGGLAVLFLAWGLNLTSRVRRLVLVGFPATLALGAAAVAVGLAGLGPGASALGGLSFKARIWYGQAAIAMFDAHPVSGAGLDSFGYFYRALRPVAATRQIGGNDFTDAAHNVPLQMLAQGGLLLGLAYAALVVVTVISLTRGLRRLQGSQRLLLGALGGAWVASQLQSWVSIDQVPLIVVQYVLAGAVVVAAGGTHARDISLPGRRPAAPPPSARGRRRPVAAVERMPPLTGAATAALAAVVVVALLGGWFALRPSRADVAAARGDQARIDQRLALALSDYQRATRLMPGVSRYWARVAALYNDMGQIQPALDAYRQATKYDPYDVDAWRNTGRLADASLRFDLAHTCFVRAAQLDPSNPATVLDLAKFDLRHDRAKEAQDVLSDALRVLPQDAGMLASLGDTQAVLGEAAAARTSYERALQIQPGEATATAGLAKLKKPS